MIKFNAIKTPFDEIDFDEKSTQLKQIHKGIWNREIQGNEFMDWLKWADDIDFTEVEDMLSTVEHLKNKLKVQKMLVIGIGGSYLGAKAAIDFVKGSSYDNVRFAGINLASDHFKQIEEWLNGSKWAITIISKSGTTLEPSIAFRYFKDLLSKQFKDFNDRIVAITDKEKGTLKEMAIENGWKTFVVPDGIGGRFSGITPVGLFPMAFAGIDIQKLLYGVKQAQDKYNNEDVKHNDAYRYALFRYLLSEKSISEIFATYDPDLNYLSEWIKQLFGESEGKEGKGLLPNSVSYTADLHSLGQWLQEGNVKDNVFETTIWVEKSNNEIKVPITEDDKENINSLSSVTLDDINREVMNAVVDAHYEGGVPQLIITIPNKTEETLGYLWYFFFITTATMATLMGVNAFNQPGVEKYKAKMNENLKNIDK